VVVIPLDSDVSSKQFNDLVSLINQNRVQSGFVISRCTSEAKQVSNSFFGQVILAAE
jgi:hypothetical protein